MMQKNNSISGNEMLVFLSMAVVPDGQPASVAISLTRAVAVEQVCAAVPSASTVRTYAIRITDEIIQAVATAALKLILQNGEEDIPRAIADALSNTAATRVVNTLIDGIPAPMLHSIAEAVLTEISGMLITRSHKQTRVANHHRNKQ